MREIANLKIKCGNIDLWNKSAVILFFIRLLFSVIYSIKFWKWELFWIADYAQSAKMITIRDISSKWYQFGIYLQNDYNGYILKWLQFGYILKWLQFVIYLWKLKKTGIAFDSKAFFYQNKSPFTFFVICWPLFYSRLLALLPRWEGMQISNLSNTISVRNEIMSPKVGYGNLWMEGTLNQCLLFPQRN